MANNNITLGLGVLEQAAIARIIQVHGLIVLLAHIQRHASGQIVRKGLAEIVKELKDSLKAMETQKDK